jgi:hypothetical protein
MTTRYFLTVDWCNQGKRGIFCTRDGTPFGKETQHTEDGMLGILGAFDLVLNPQSLPYTEEELKQFHLWTPLAEYSHAYGVARKE